MRKMIKAEIYHDGEYYCARCLDVDVFTQGKTLDQVVANLKEAIELHLSIDGETAINLHSNPSLLTFMDLGEINV